MGRHDKKKPANSTRSGTANRHKHAAPTVNSTSDAADDAAAGPHPTTVADATTAAQTVVIVRLRTHGQRFEVPVWAAVYTAWRDTGRVPEEAKATALVAPAQVVAAKTTSRRSRRGKRKGGKHADDDDDASDDSGDEQRRRAETVIDGIFAMLADKRNIYVNCYRRQLATKKAQNAAFGTTGDDDLEFVASAVVRGGTVVETDTGRAASKQQTAAMFDDVVAHLTQGMLVNRYSGEPPDDSDVKAAIRGRAAASSTSSGGGATAALDADVFDDEFLEVDFGRGGAGDTAAAGGGGGVGRDVMAWLKQGADAWSVAGFAAQRLATAPAGIGVDHALRAVAVAKVRLVGKPDGAQGGSSSTDRPLGEWGSLLLAATEALVRPCPVELEPVATKLLHAATSAAGEPAAALTIIVDAGFAGVGVQSIPDPTPGSDAATGKRPPAFSTAPLLLSQRLAAVAAAVGIPSSRVGIEVDAVAPLNMLDHAKAFEMFTARDVDLSGLLSLLVGHSGPSAAEHPPSSRKPTAAAGASSTSTGGQQPAAAMDPAEKWGRMTHVTLQAECKKRGLGVGGKKAALVERLVAAARADDDDDGESTTASSSSSGVDDDSSEQSS